MVWWGEWYSQAHKEREVMWYAMCVKKRGGRSGGIACGRPIAAART